VIQGKLQLTSPQDGRRQFVAESSSGHTFLLDDAHGNTGARPIEVALLALGGCSAFDVINILRKKRQRVTGYEIELTPEQRGEPPMVFTRVEIRHLLRGRIDPEAVRKAIQLSETKYCSVGAMIGKSAQIIHSFKIEPEESSASAQEENDEACLRVSVRS
jgi:putative redox protein